MGFRNFPTNNLRRSSFSEVSTEDSIPIRDTRRKVHREIVESPSNTTPRRIHAFPFLKLPIFPQTLHRLFLMSDPLPPVPSLPPPPPPPFVPGAQDAPSPAPLDGAWMAPPPPGFFPQAPLAPETPEAGLPPGPEPVSPAKRFWRKFGGDGFLVSLGVHILLVIIIATWVTSHYIINSSKPEDFVTGSGGGKSGNKVTMSEHRIKPKNSRTNVKTPTRLVSKSPSASVSIPALPNLNMPALQSGSLGGALSKGLGGGEGGGIGSGHGLGRGGGKNFVSSPFGMNFRQNNTMEGTLYDLKRSRSGGKLYAPGDANLRIAEMRKAYAAFIKGGMRKDFFDSRYTASKEKLYTTNIFIPTVAAEAATQAFNCEKEITAPGWLGYYEGWISPPETGQYRFAGMGDDAMLVAVGHDVKLWAPWTQGGMQTWVKKKANWEPKVAYTPNGSLPGLGAGGRYYGSWFSMSKGQRYFIQIVIAECYGGLFSSELMIQQKSKLSDALPDNNTPLPIFKLAPLTPDELKIRTGSKMRWVADGPSFGCELNGAKVRGGERSGGR
jgi:hypothetical protein